VTKSNYSTLTSLLTIPHANSYQFIFTSGWLLIDTNSARFCSCYYWMATVLHLTHCSKLHFCLCICCGREMFTIPLPNIGLFLLAPLSRFQPSCLNIVNVLTSNLDRSQLIALLKNVNYLLVDRGRRKKGLIRVLCGRRWRNAKNAGETWPNHGTSALVVLCLRSGARKKLKVKDF
jgi:hypothetical protein